MLSLGEIYTVTANRAKPCIESRREQAAAAPPVSPGPVLLSPGSFVDALTMGRTYEDFPVGSRFVSPCQTLSAEEIVAFARQYDPQPFHLESDPNDNLLGGLAASGWQTAAISMRLFVDMMQVEGGIIGRALDELRWPLAVHPGDSIRVEIEILEARLSQSKPGYGLIRYRSLTINQEDKVVQSFIALAILPARSAPPVDETGGQ